MRAMLALSNQLGLGRSVLRTLNRTVQNFEQVSSHTVSGVARASNSVPSSDSAPRQSDSYPPASSLIV